MEKGQFQCRAAEGMHPFVSGRSFVLCVVAILLSVLAFYHLRKKKKSAGKERTEQAPAPPLPIPIGGEGNQFSVFLSFKGSDTRKTFTDHLYRSLLSTGASLISVFKDDESLPIGKDFGPQILDAITRSNISIPIISEEYASSKWCLRELIHMMDRKKNASHIVLPIFYKVDPSDVRYLKGSFGRAFHSRKRRFDVNDIKKGQEALTEVSYLNGWESEKFASGCEGALVEKIVETVLSELRHDFQLVVDEHLVGIDGPLEKIRDWAHTSTNDARVIGIYGMGGIGKTTIAKYFYNELSNDFKCRSFLQDIRARTARDGVHCVQNQLIKDIRPNHKEVLNFDDGINAIKFILKGNKVLILLDDIDDNRQLDALSGEQNWFTPGSIIIITTRYKSVLDKSKLEVFQYELKELNDEHSVCLFNRHAFRMGHSLSNFEGISGDIVSTTGGLPLALKVIGSYLYGETNQKVWNDVLNQLKKRPHNDVQRTLKISYDALEEGQKEIFLDIACFFIGEESKYAIYMWDGSGFYAYTGIRELKQRCLIEIEDDGSFKMHDQLRDLGRSIVCKGQSPENRSRLWDEEAVNVLHENKGTETIQKMRIKRISLTKPYTNEEFKNLPSLRFLQLGGNGLYGDFGTSFSELRWLQCVCPANHKSLPTINLNLPKLVVLQLSRGYGEECREDWDGWSSIMSAKRLKVLDLCGWTVDFTPNLSAFPELEILNLQGCSKLEKLHHSIGTLKCLVSFNLSLCRELRELPEEMGRLKELTELSLHCTRIKKFPDSIGSLQKLKRLCAMRCESLEEIPSSFGNLSSLQYLDLLDCSSLIEIPTSLGNLSSLQRLDLDYCEYLREIPSSFGNLSSLQHLGLSNCKSLRVIPGSFGNLSSLQYLDLRECSSLKEIPTSLGNLSSLQRLDLSNCESLREIPSSFGNLSSLQHLRLSYCKSLREIPSSFGNLSSLQHLYLDGCSSLTEIPTSFGNLSSLQHLDLGYCESLREIPDFIGDLRDLQLLDMSNCRIEKIPHSIGKLKNLQRLCITHYENTGIPLEIGDLSSLQKLELEGLVKIGLETELPSGFTRHSLSSDGPTLPRLSSLIHLQELRLSGYKLLEHIPELPSTLQRLSLFACPKVQLPELDRLNHLEQLSLIECNNLNKFQALDDLESLEEIILERCRSIQRLILPKCLKTLKTHCDNLVDIRSHGDMDSLKAMDIDRCGSIQTLILRKVQSLEVFSAASCNKLVEVRGLDKAEFLEKLNISECVSIERLPDLSCFATLKELDISGCRLLHDVEILGRFLSCRKIFIRDCESLEKLPNLSKFEYLRAFTIINSLLITEIPGIGESRSLTEITIARCQSLETLPDFSGCENLQKLIVAECEKLTQIQGLVKLDLTVEIYKCYSLVLPELSQTLVERHNETFPDYIFHDNDRILLR